MNRQCDCAICLNKGPTVSLLTIKQHRAKHGLGPPKIQPQQPSSSDPTPSPDPAPSSDSSTPSASKSSSNMTQDVVSSIHDEILRTSLNSIVNLSQQPLGAAAAKRTDGNWLFLCVALVTYLHVVAGVSRRVVDSTLKILRLILIQFSQNISLHKFDEDLLKTFPTSSATALKWLEIESVLERSVCCPKCFKKYRNPEGDEPPIPKLCTRKETERSNWTLRNHTDHTRQANAWKDAPTHNARKKLFDTCGVRWSCLNKLEYWDPTKMVVVDTMHCISGILEYHFRRVWNLDELGKTLDKEKDDSKLSNLLQEAIDTDISMNDTWEPFQPDLDQAMGFSNSDTSSFSNSTGRRVGNLSLNPCTLTVLEEGLGDDEMDDIYDDDGEPLSGTDKSSIPDDLLSTEALKKIRSAIVHTTIPSLMSPPPSNLGSASHGKLKSSDWVVLATVHIPFVIFQLVDLGMIAPDIAINALHLCSLTEIVMNYQSSMTKIQNYFNHLTAYRATLQKLRSDLKPTPNQHMAFHVPFQHFNYGPSAYLAAWQFEQYNGILQRIPNNRKIWELDLTMLRQVCRASNLAVSLDSPDLPECVREVAPLMQCGKKLSSSIGEIPLDEDSATSTSTKAIINMSDNLCSATYQALLRKLNPHNPSSQHQLNQAITSQKLISSRVKFAKQITWSGHTLTKYESSCKNGIIEYNPTHNPEAPVFGQVLQIFHHTRWCTSTSQDIQETFISLLRYRALNESDGLRNPFKNWSDLNIQLFYTNPTKAHMAQGFGLVPELIPEVIQLHQVRYPTASYNYKSRTFGISQPTIAVKSLSRGRHTWS
ncbi:uncharacterized protein MELLADRAFT_106984 [Melampsora larici-populina 98AG31]|uniref:Uncharacterized protein n=1 Tax=Melampsora larici-populina (strain 98AG31 / pathotype 3-4-7) TaxID=747676 RepID=F4RNA8_MELLP|nr:uncharacterized protein MELLADRAFT_106984 [Melampsora larici-populina 98AG31]EGG06129.1 hypothetical protein MELLADRAFT_106984 [Melampsora larici-populina 98AG31]